MAIIKYKKNEQKQLPNNEEIQKTVITETHTKKHDDPEVLFEDETKTTATSNCYRLNDGTSKIIVSSETVNYFDEEESHWKKVDNELVETNDSFVNKNGKYHVEIAKPNKGTSIKIGHKGNYVSWEYLGKKTKKSSENKEVELFVTRHKGKHSQNSAATYKKIDSSTDIEYILHGNNIKENIIVTEKSDNYQYDFILNTKGLKLRLSEDSRQIELYNIVEGDETIEFIIPSPYMYDANGQTSYEVYYEIDDLGNDKYSFSVVANADWINNEERVFPVTIDPQVIENIENDISFKTYHRTVSYSSYGNWVLDEANSFNVYRTSNIEYKVEITVSKLVFERIGNSCKELKLYLKPTPDTFQNSTSVPVYVDSVRQFLSEGNYFVIDLTSKLNTNTDLITTITTYVSSYFVKFYKTEYPPYLEAISSANENVIPSTKTIPLCSGVSGDFNLYTGEFTSIIEDVNEVDSVFALPIYHVYKKTSTDYNLGNYFRLNIDQKFIKNSNSTFTFINEKGQKVFFVEKYYYFDLEGNKIYLDDSKKSVIDADLNGNLTLSSNNEKLLVFVEYISNTNLKVQTKLDGFRYIEYIEQRNQEIKQLEEQILSYENVFEQYYCFDTETSQKVYNMSEYYSTIYDFKSLMTAIKNVSTYYLMTEDEIFKYMSLNEYEDSSLANNQKQSLLNNNTRTIELVKKYFKEYLNLKESLRRTIINTPVSYISDGEIIKGFNENGDLVMIFDKYENYTILEYETYYDLNGNEKIRITRAYDNFDKTVSFSYGSDFKLEAITDAFGNKTTYSYLYGFLLSVSNDKYGTKIKLSYNMDSNIAIIEDVNNKKKITFDYINNNLSKITYKSLIEFVDIGSVIERENDIDEISFQQTNNTTTITNGIVCEKYQFDEDGNKKAYVLIENGTVKIAETYEYVPYWIEGVAQSNPRYVTKSVKKEYLGNSELVNLTFDSSLEYYVTTTVINQFNKPQLKSVSTFNITDDNTKTISLEYFYDKEQKLIEKIETVRYSNPDTIFATHKKYNYNSYGKLVKIETFVENEELTNGRTIEEIVYDNKGNVIKSFTYNSLDPSTKFYNEVSCNEEGQVVETYDSTGLYKTTSKYVNNELVESILPNGSRIGYGYIDGENVSITHSTIEGEENSNQKVIKDGQVVEVNSGNNHIQYTYDYKGRITNVNLDGVANYITFTYVDDSTTNVLEQETITYNNDSVITNTYDSRGNLTQQKLNEEVLISNTYDSRNLLLTKTIKDGRTLNYSRDDWDRLLEVSGTGYNEAYNYDNYGNITQLSISGPLSIKYNYEYNNDSFNRLTKTIIDDSITYTYSYDKNNRYIGKKLNNIIKEKINYYKVGDHATNLPSVLRFDRLSGGGVIETESIRYAYDSMGNITKVYQDGELAIRYTYDSLNRLVREDNKSLGQTKVFVYDNNGNILKQRMFDFTLKDNLSLEEIESIDKEYLYEGDKLLSFNGNLLSYDEDGLLSNYINNQLTWNSLKQLVGYGSNTFTYDGLGRRISKNNTQYVYDSNGRLLKEETNGNVIKYLYDKNGISGFIYNGVTYFYRKNTQGDVIGIIDTDGEVVVRYLYDGWGNHAVCNPDGTDNEEAGFIGNINPIRYRGYYYDVETQLFYCNSRYYSPELCRWISPDSIEYLDPQSINGLNLYCYCYNNPISYADPSGCFPVLACILGLTALVGMGLTIGGVASDNNLMTAIGLTMVAIPALISGGLAAFATTGALATWIGAGTMVAGAGTSLFASAEYQEAFTGNNWMLDAGMSEDWYNGLMIATASLATLGTLASSFAYSFNINSISKVGNLEGTNYKGIRFSQIEKRGGRRVKVYKTLEFHTHSHMGYNPHWQLNNFSYYNGVWHRGSAAGYWKWWLGKI